MVAASRGTGMSQKGQEAQGALVQEALSATLPVLEFVDRGLKARGTLRTKGELCKSQGGDRDTVEELGTLQATDDRAPPNMSWGR